MSEASTALEICLALEASAASHNRLATTRLLSRLGVERTKRQYILRVCHRLEDRDILRKIGQGKFTWELIDFAFDRQNPLVKKAVRGSGDEPTSRTSGLDELRAEVVALRNELRSIETGTVTRELVIKQTNKPDVKLDGIVHPVFEQVMFHIACGDNVMLVGPKGCGKTHICEQIAKALDRPHSMLSLSGGVTESKIFGRLVPNITTGKNEYHSTAFVELFEEGGVFLLDEVDAADPNVLLSINGALANGKMPLDRPGSKAMARKSDEFVCLAAANTWGNGADRQYVGRNQQDGAFTERFVQIAMDYDRSMEAQLCSDLPDFVRVMHTYRDRIVANRLERTLSTRFILRAANWLRNGKNMDYVRDMLFAGWREDEVRKITL